MVGVDEFLDVPVKGLTWKNDRRSNPVLFKSLYMTMAHGRSIKLRQGDWVARLSTGDTVLLSDRAIHHNFKRVPRGN